MIDPHRLARRAGPEDRPCTIWNQADFLEIRSIVGSERAKALLRTYVLQLGAASASVRATASAKTQLRETAHDLKSMSGQLGFCALQNFCERVLACENKLATQNDISLLLDLIEASSDAAQVYCNQSKAIGGKPKWPSGLGQPA